MKKLVLGLVVSLISVTGFAHDDGKVSTAKVAELSAHRIDRLVTLNKIDSGFLKKLDKIEVTKVENAAPVAFKSVVSQTKPATGSPLQVEILFDHDGKPLSFKALAGGAAGSDPQWTEKDAGSLVENALHYVLENSALPMVAPYFSSLTSFTLNKGTLNGKPVVDGVLASSAQAQKLHVYLKLDGTFISAEVLP